VRCEDQAHSHLHQAPAGKADGNKRLEGSSSQNALQHVVIKLKKNETGVPRFNGWSIAMEF